MTTANASSVRMVTVVFPELPNEHHGRMLWFASWLEGSGGSEGEWFYSGRGGEVLRIAPPPTATGIRVRRWVSEGLPPEYADAPLEAGHIRAEFLDFDASRPFSTLSPGPGSGA